MIQLPEIYKIAIAACLDASAVIMNIYSSHIDVEIKSDGSPVTAADIASSEIIAAQLEKTGIPVISEELEMSNYLTRSKWKENWCVDPLDGTKMFILKNDEFSINIAHIRNGTSIFGIIASPVERKIIAGGSGFGVHVFSYEDCNTPSNWRLIEPPNVINNPLVVTCSRSFHDSDNSFIHELELQFNAINYLKKGSALKFFDLAEGIADIYPRFAPTMEWDIAAGQAILEALGGEIRDLENDVLTYNKKNLYNPFFIARTKAILL